MSAAGNENWYLHVRTFYNNFSQNIRLSSNWYYLDYGFTSGTCYFSSPQLEGKQFVSPFVNGTRSTIGDLEYNLNRDYGLDWNADWSICYWKKPMGTSHPSLLTDYSIDSVGCNSNSVGGGYFWWGKTSGSNIFSASSFTFSTSTTLNPSTYFNKWQFITLIKSGTTITLTFYLDDGTTVSATYVPGAITSNRYVTQYGYDLKLGGWDDVNVCNAFFKDLIVAKRALTAAEVDNIRKLQLRNKKGLMLIPGSVKEVPLLT
jgi:hypothetical protein